MSTKLTIVMLLCAIFIFFSLSHLFSSSLSLSPSFSVDSQCMCVCMRRHCKFNAFDYFANNGIAQHFSPISRIHGTNQLNQIEE